MSEMANMKLNELLDQYNNIEKDKEKVRQQQNVIYCIDHNLKEINESGYSVDSFDPKDITVYPNGKVEFAYTSKIDGDKDAAVRKNLKDAAILGIKIYLDHYDDIDMNFLKENFGDFSFAIPEDDLKYYKGVLLNNLKVYYGDYDKERKKRDMAKLKEMAFIPVQSFGLLVVSMGALTCLIGYLVKIFA